MIQQTENDCYLKMWYAGGEQVFANPAIGYAIGDTILGCGVSVPSYDQSLSGSISAYPNPTSGVSSFGFRVSSSGKVTLRIYDLHGREVAMVIDRQLPVGEHTVSFDASHLPSGVYIYRKSSVVSHQSSVGKLIKY
jgi:hypothetical protein